MSSEREDERTKETIDEFSAFTARWSSSLSADRSAPPISVRSLNIFKLPAIIAILVALKKGGFNLFCSLPFLFITIAFIVAAVERDIINSIVNKYSSYKFEDDDENWPTFLRRQIKEVIPSLFL
jgi:hypothetical protein